MTRSIKHTSADGSTTYGDFGYVGASSGIISGTYQGDVVVRTADAAKALHLGCGPGFASMRITSDSLVCNPLTVNGAFSCGTNAATVGAISSAAIASSGAVSGTDLQCRGADTVNRAIRHTSADGTTTYGDFGYAGATNYLLTGTAKGDVVVRTANVGNAVHLGCGTGFATMRIASDGIACGPLTVNGAFSCGTNSATTGALSSGAITSSGAISSTGLSVTGNISATGRLTTRTVNMGPKNNNEYWDMTTTELGVSNISNAGWYVFSCTIPVVPLSSGALTGGGMGFVVHDGSGFAALSCPSYFSVTIALNAGAIRVTNGTGSQNAMSFALTRML